VTVAARAALSARALQAIDATPDFAEAIIRNDLALSVNI
jgi:hypothetical protein